MPQNRSPKGSLGLGLLAWPYKPPFTTSMVVNGLSYTTVFGVFCRTKEPGLHFKIPYVQYPFIYDVKSRPRTVQTATGSKDLQEVNISLRIFPTPYQKRSRIHGEIGMDYDDRILPSIAPEILKATLRNTTQNN